MMAGRFDEGKCIVTEGVNRYPLRSDASCYETRWRLTTASSDGRCTHVFPHHGWTDS
jgi:hypothetical protein